MLLNSRFRKYLRVKFSIRSVLLLVFVIGLYVASWTKVRESNRSATKEIESLTPNSVGLNGFRQPIGGEICYYFVTQYPLRCPQWVPDALCISGNSNYCFDKQDLRSEDLKFLADLAYLVDLHVEDCKMPTGWISSATECKLLTSLVIVSTPIETVDFNALRRLKVSHLGLCDLELSHDRRGRLLREIMQMRELSSLCVDTCGLSDLEVRQIKIYCEKSGIEFDWGNN